jgi:hypothetical protein
VSLGLIQAAIWMAAPVVDRDCDVEQQYVIAGVVEVDDAAQAIALE